ncbi:MAG: hypothetical protein D6820_04850 [Lentisphaerae bacterium]|nr:MAG: hypothetical protein D6820_04850 [Lentisphaerota bacterium]
MENYNPVITFLRERLATPLFIEVHRLAPYPPPRPGAPPRGTEVGVVHDLMIHDLDLVLDLVGDQVQTIDAVGTSVLSPSEDIANVRLHFNSGCIANITASRISPERMRKIRVFQENAYYSLDYERQSGEIFSLTPQGIIREPVPIREQNALACELDAFLKAVLEFRETKRVPPIGVSGERGLQALELADAIVHQINERLSSRLAAKNS